MQRWSTVALGCVALVAFVVLLWWGGARQTGPTPRDLPIPGSAALPLALPALSLTPPSVDSALLPLPSALPSALAGSPSRTLPANAPRSIRFGVVLVKYRGAEMAGDIDRPRADALAIARAVADLAKKDFKEAVKHGDAGSTADAGRVSRGILEPALENELFLLAPGAVTGPLDTPRGYWIARRLE